MLHIEYTDVDKLWAITYISIDMVCVLKTQNTIRIRSEHIRSISPAITFLFLKKSIKEKEIF